MKLLLAALLGLLPACGGGNIGDLFSIFPSEAFTPPGGGGPGGGGPGGGGQPFVPAEVASLGGSDGVSGDVKNIAIATVDARTYAFLAAGTSGLHVVDVTEPDLLNRGDFVTTVRDAVLTAPAALAGGRCDALAVVDGTFLVCLAVGSGAANAVTVFSIPDLIASATNPTADLSGAFLPPAAGSEIPAPGNADGKGGGVSGSSAIFFVAGGGATLGRGTIDPVAGEWTADAPIPVTTTPPVDRVLDVLTNQTAAIYLSVKAGTQYGVVTMGHPSLPIPVPPTFASIDGDFATLAGQFIAGPGNLPLDLALDTFSLFVSGDDEVQAFNTTNPIAPARLDPIQGTGPDTIAVAASGGQVAVGAGDFLRVYAALGGQTRLLAQVSFPGTFTVRGVAFRSSDAGSFVLCCAGTNGGLRVVQLTRSQP